MKKILPRNISSSMNAIQHPASPILRRIPSRYANKMLTPQQEITAMTIGKNTSPRSPERIVLDMVECTPDFHKNIDKKDHARHPDDLLTLRKQMHQWSMAEKDQNRKHDI